MPQESAESSVLFPWKPPPATSVTPSGIPIPDTSPRFGSSTETRNSSGPLNGTAPAPVRAAVPAHELANGALDAAREEVLEGHPAHEALEERGVEAVLLRAD